MDSTYDVNTTQSRHIVSDDLRKFHDETVDYLSRARTIKGLKQAIAAVIRPWGFTDFTVEQMSMNNGAQPAFITFTVSPALVDMYLTLNYHRDSMGMSRFLLDRTIIRYSDLYEYFVSHPTDKQQIQRANDEKKLLHDYGYSNSYSLSILHTSENGKILYQLLFTLYIPLTKNIKEMDTTIQLYRPKITVLTEALCGALDKIMPIIYPSDTAITRLTKKQMAVLIALGQYSMTQQQIANHVGLTESTVRTYCKHIKNKLGKKTLSGAVYEGVRLGLIPLDNKE